MPAASALVQTLVSGFDRTSDQRSQLMVGDSSERTALQMFGYGSEWELT